MEVVVISDYGHVAGGASQVTVESVKALASVGIPVTFIYGVGPLDSSIDATSIEAFDLTQMDLLSNPSRLDAATSGIWNVEVARRTGAILDRMNRSTTIIHAHTWMKSLSASVLHAALSRGFKVVLTLHDYFAVCPNGGLFNFQTQRACTLTPMSLVCIGTHCDVRSYPQKLWRVARQVVQARAAGVPGGVRHFISVSDFSEQLFRKWLPDTARYWRVTNAIDLDRAAPADPGRHSTFSFVGRLSAEKGAVLFATASHEAKVAARFLGDGDMCSSVLAANPNAQMLGWCDRASVRKYLLQSRAVVFPTLLYETQGLIPLEAAAVGMPCIVSDGCASRNYVEHGVTGLWFESGSVQSLVEQLKKLDAEPQLAAAMGREAYSRYWADPPNIARHLEELMACYDGILASNTL